ncbi:hypothetical protein BJX66DRAFT_334182 [Aspergillus keveii]|uniref:beta-glucosidase n=1 Tax=Aspergillus keveii TaxID=714993 RepID=A0ABR4GHS9_9EURO
MDLTPYQYDLVDAVLAANPNTVVVNYSGSPVSMSALGNKNPSECLQFTWPWRLKDSPTFENWPTNDNDEICYKEGLFVGYRYYDQPGSPT